MNSTTHRSTLPTIALLFLVAGCKADPARLAGDAGNTRSAGDAGDAGIASSSSQDDGPIVDLLHAVEATVWTSSRIDNPHDHPEHLVDGKQATAWNGKTGDLHGWIAFRVPSMVKVTRVDITVGFDKKTPSGDLFTMNHRIKRVRLSRNGVVLREVTLDVERRTPQGIEMDAPGGDFRIDVLETIPGTKKEWRELTVSELRVWGRAGGAPTNPTHLPRLAVGGLDVPPPDVSPRASRVLDIPRGPFATIAELCAAIDKLVIPPLRAEHGEDAFPEQTYCKKGEQYGFDPGMFRNGPFEDTTLIDFDDLESNHTSLAVKTRKGWYRTDVHVRSHHHMDPGCMDAVRQRVEDVRVIETAPGRRVAILRTVERETKWGNPQSSENASVWTERAHACALDASLAPTCEGPLILATATAPNPPEFTEEDERFFVVNLGSIPWKNRKAPVLGPLGELRAATCADAGCR